MRVVVASRNPVKIGRASGLLTDGRYTHEGICTQTLIIALTPFVNDLYPQFSRAPG